jgi:DNA mismatch endonuclease, patch repair protein
MDRLSPQQRSWNMSRVHSRDTRPEKCVRSMLHRMGFRFSLRRMDLPGKPDIVLPKYRIVIMVHGCFWHQHHGCPKAKLPTSNSDFWVHKLSENRRRDCSIRKLLRERGWKVITVWECQLSKSPNRIASKLYLTLQNQEAKNDV